MPSLQKKFNSFWASAILTLVWAAWLVNNKLIFLPAGRAKFTIIDARDIGLAGAIVPSDPDKHINKCYELTNYEKLSFSEMAAKIISGVGTEIK